MIEWYSDYELTILFDCEPNPIIRFPKPDDSKETKKNIKKYPFISLDALKVQILYKNNKYEFTIPSMYRWDGASIPRIFWRIIGSNTQPEFLIPSLLHDFVCENHACINNDVLLSSKILKSLLLIADVPKWKADLMFFAVNSYQSVFCKW